MSNLTTPARLARQLRDFAARRQLPAAPPFRLWVDITSRCNLACRACVQKDLPAEQRRHMDEGLLDRLAQQAGQLGQVNLFHRGEPLLHPRFGYWAARFKAAGASLRVHSNATLLNPDTVAHILAAGPHFLTLSVDSLSDHLYRANRKGASLASTLAGVELLLKAKRICQKNLPHISLLLMGPQNWGPLEKQRLATLQGLGLNRVIHRGLHNWGGSLAGAVGSGRPAVCTFPWYGLAVLSDGRATPCPQDFFGAMELGRADEQSLLEIWRGRPLARLRAAHAGHDLSAYPVCAACDRIRRPTLAGIPLEHLANFARETLSR